MKARTKRQVNRATAFDLRAGLAVFLSTCLALPVSAATSFPDYPLQTGVASVPPNILFILDDSTSMSWEYMPDEANSGEFRLRNIAFNKIAYDPSRVYEPWVDAEGNHVAGGRDFSGGVFKDDYVLGDNRSGLLGDLPQVFYVPKSSALSGSTSPRNYYKYSIDKDPDGPVSIERCEESSSNSYEFDNNCETKLPAARSLDDELRNYATWYSFHRTRMKVAKAGASLAFSGLGRNFRVGFNTIHDSKKATDPGNTIVPVTEGSDLFEGANKARWFKALHEQAVPSGSTQYTPLRTALVMAGEYFSRDDPNGPWGPQDKANQLVCRQNFAILTTDGYWNTHDEDKASSDVDTAFDSIGNADNTNGPNGYVAKAPYKDDHSSTLADVAMHYWKTDLRGDMDDRVPVSSGDPASWQHMVTFGISIGLSGSSGYSSVDQVLKAGNVSWNDPTNGPDLGDADRIDDLLHAAVNGRGSFLTATDAESFASALDNALGDIAKRRSSGSNVTSNGPQLNAGSRIFQATFTSGEWSGDVQSIGLAPSGGIGASSWSMAEVIKADPAKFLGRGVFTWDSAKGKGNTFPTKAQEGELERDGGIAPVTGVQNAQYIKGDRSREGGAGKLRVRTSPVGDIVNSSPFFSEQAAALFIGANDGMLHAVNSASGAVMFSYVPGGIDLAALSSLSHPEYEHRFFVDGGIDVTTQAQGGGKNILVGSLGRGGKGIFALDVTDPSGFKSENVLWDATGPDVDADMGYVVGAPLVRKGHATGGGSATYAFVGNGIESANKSSALFVYNAGQTGAVVVKKFVVDAAGGGLAPPRAADTNLDGIADTLYAGDLSGSLWKFDISGDVDEWSYTKVFAAVDESGKPQPITAPVAIAREPVTERIFVTFGTGRYISVDDITNEAPQTLYALIDDGSTISGRADLEERTIARTGVDAKGRPARAWEAHAPLPATAKGWFVDLGTPDAGERVVTGPFMRGRALWFSSIIPQPGSGCDAGGRGYLNAIDAFTGTSPQSGGGTGTYMDIDGDGEGDDKLGGDQGGGSDGFVGSVDLGLGMVGQGVGVGSGVYACGSEAECGYVPTPPDTSGARRLGWRELFNRN